MSASDRTVQDALQQSLREALGDRSLLVRAAHRVGGGGFGQALRLETTAGRFFAKWSSAASSDIFLCEAQGLRALASAATTLVVPRVLAAGTGALAFLVTEWLDARSSAAADDAEALGRGLAALHRARSAAYGFPTHSYCGTTRQDNTSAASWAEFYAERRLRPLLLETTRRRGLAAAQRGVFERLLDRLAALLPPEEGPSLIHGDLWSGNVMATDRGPALFDPACAHAEREMEFGIATLFGGFDSRFFAAYEEAWPLARGWRERNPLYQLYHLLNHYLLFGGHYATSALATARLYL